MGLTVGCWICYLIGTLLHAGLQIAAIANAHKQPWVETFRAVLLNLAARVFVATMVLMLLGQYPAALSNLIKLIGWEPSNTSLYMSAPMAGIFGYAFDNVLAFIPFLKSQVPSLDPPGDK